MTTTIGPYTQGENPDPLEHTFLDDDGNPIDLTGYTPSARLLPPGGSESVLLSCSVPDPETGTVRVAWPDGGITDAGTHRLEVWVVGARTYASERFRFYARAALPVED